MTSTLPDGSWMSSSKRAGTRCKSSKKNALETKMVEEFYAQTQSWSKLQQILPTKWHQATHHVRKTIRSSSSSFSVKLCLQRSIWLAATSCLGVWANSAGWEQPTKLWNYLVVPVVHMAKYCNNWTWFCTVTTKCMTSGCCLSICSYKTCLVILWTWLSGISNILELLTSPAVYL